LSEDVVLATHIEKMRQLVASGSIKTVVEKHLATDVWYRSA